MNRLKTLDSVKEEIRKLEEYVELVETYKTETLTQKIIKAYACTNSLAKTLSIVNVELKENNQPLIELSLVIDLIKSKPQDELHKLVRANYFSKVKFLRSRTYSKSSH